MTLIMNCFARIAVLCIGTIVTQSAAQQPFSFRRVHPDGTASITDPWNPINPAAVSLNYNNYQATIFGGMTAIRGGVAVGYQEFGDDLNLVGAVGNLSSFGFGISNRSLINGLGLGEFVLRARRRTDGSLIGQTTFAFDMDMAPNEGAFFAFPDGFVSSANITLSNEVWMTFQWNYINGAASPSDFWMIYGAPQALGSSSSIARNFTTGTDIDLGGGGLPNSFMWYVATSPVPSPGAIVTLLCSAGLVVRRRRV
jgi:hypothetical protein